MQLNVDALSAVAAFGAILMLVLGFLYVGAMRAQARGELGADGIRLLEWAIVGQLVIYGILAITAFIV